MDPDLLQLIVRRRLDERRLPARGAIGIRETWGDGRSCDVCEEQISPHEKLVIAMVSLQWMSVGFHVDCYKAWDVERLAHDRHAR